MFKKLFLLIGNVTLSLTIARSEDNMLTVGVTPKSEGSQISPVILSGTPEELDKRFVETISGFIQDSAGFIMKKDAAKKSMEEKAKAKEIVNRKNDKITDGVKKALVQTSIESKAAEPVKAATEPVKEIVTETNLFDSLI